MAGISVYDLSCLIKRYTSSQETLSENLSKIYALLHVALSGNFAEQPEEIIHDYLWAVQGLIEQSKDLGNQVLDGLMNIY